MPDPRRSAARAPSAAPLVVPPADVPEAAADPTRAAAVWARLADLEPWADNPRVHPRAQVDALSKLIETHGFTTAMTAHWPSRVIIKGHGRRLACLALWKRQPDLVLPGAPGPGYVPVRFRGGTFEQARADALADNRIQEDAEWDNAALGALLSDMRREEADLAALAASTGFRADEVSELIRRHEDRPAPRDVKPPPVAAPPLAPVSERGRVYRLGPHRLMCGDSTSPDDVRELLAGEMADVSFMDPPFAIFGSSSGLSASITDDKIVRPFFRDVLLAAQGGLRTYAHAYVCCDWRSWASWWEMAKQTALAVKNMLVWDKGNAGLGNNYGNTHELIGFFAHWPAQKVMSATRPAGAQQVLHPNMLRDNYGPGDDGPARLAVDADAVVAALEAGVDVRADPREFLRYGRVLGRERLHNAAKPVALVEELIGNSSQAGALMLDLFGGSGTTLIACARTERRARLMEIDPHWCDVIRDRWTRWAREARVDEGPDAMLLAAP